MKSEPEVLIPVSGLPSFPGRPLSDDLTVVFAAVLVELAALEAKLEGLHLLLQSPESVVDLLRVGYDGRVTAGACEVRLLAKASDRALSLLAALRAGNAQLGLIGIEDSHVDRSGVGCGTDEESVSRPAGGISPADGASGVGQ